VLVELRRLVLEAEASWDGNMARSFNILRECVKRGPGSGGYAYGGVADKKWVRVSLMRNDMGGGNETFGEAMVAAAR
jgi:hypothetical protein